MIHDHRPMIRKKTRWGLMFLIAAVIAFGSFTGWTLYKHPGFLPGGGYPAYWHCDDTWCGIFMETPDGPMAWPIPPSIRNEIEQQRVNTIRV